MEVDLRNRHAVRMALRFRDELIHRNHVCTHRILQRQMPDDMLDIRHAAVVVMPVAVFMLMRMFVIVIVVMLMFMFVVMMMLMFVYMVVSVMFVVVHVSAFFFLAVHRNGKMRAVDAAFRAHFHLKFHTGDTERVQLVEHCLFVVKQF